MKIHHQLLDMLVAQKSFARNTSKLRWLKPRAKFPHEDSKQGLAKTRPAMTIIVQQAYYNGRGPNTQKVK